MRADIQWKGNVVECNKRAAGPAGLAVLWPVDGVGTILLETTRLLERKEPYVLPLELARSQIMRMNHKSEEWGLFDAPDAAPFNAKLAHATQLLIKALKADTPAQAAEAGQKALEISVKTGEDLTRLYANILLQRRKETAGFSRRVFGCQVAPTTPVNKCAKLLADAFDFASLPIHWKQIESTERVYHFKPLDTWVEWLTKNHIPIKGSSLVCFEDHCTPDWLHIWEHDFETIRDLVAEHVRRVINRYGSYIQVWDVLSGVHAVQRFSFNFEQLMELTRLALNITRQLAPRATTIIDVVAPWGEYYARNQRTIPPMLYLDMAIQSGINFDAIGLQFIFGAGADGMYVRDMFQISSLIDRFGTFGKPVHVTAAQVPSDTAVLRHGGGGQKLDVKAGGAWHDPWNETVQSHWLREFSETALSRPFVETITWRDLTDAPTHLLPHGGLIKTDLTTKKAYQELINLRREIVPHEPGS